jgi:hypothetical protein
MDLPFPSRFVDVNPNPGRHGCHHEECTQRSHAGWCQHWVVLEYSVNKMWDTETWRGKLEAVLPGVYFSFTGVEWCFRGPEKSWFYLVHLRMDRLRHRVNEDMLNQLRRVGEGEPGVKRWLVRSFPHCCSMRRRRGKNFYNLSMACHEEDEVPSSTRGRRRVLFGDEYTRKLLGQIWHQVDARIAQIEAEEPEKTKTG